MTNLTNDSESNISLVRTLSKASFINFPIVADLTFCQAILEAGLRSSPPSLLALKYNNLFGIKGTGTAGSISMPTHEYQNGQYILVNQVFARNNSVEDSLAQHKRLFMSGTSDNTQRYANLFGAKTFEEAATLIRQDGYATDPAYTNLLIDLYNKYCND